METSKTLAFFTTKAAYRNGAIFVDTGISAGFPSSADDFN
jgi:DNA polymerase V